MFGGGVIVSRASVSAALKTAAIAAGVFFAIGAGTDAQAESRQLEIKIKGGTATYVPLEKAGLPQASLPGVKFITSDAMAKMKEPTESGVFIIDAQAVPRNMPTLLKQASFSLSPDGTLTNAKGEKIALFAHSLTYRLESGQKRTEVPSLWQFASGVFDVIVPPARAGVPHPFSCFTTEIWAVYQVSAFHRWQQAHTYAEANGAEVGGTCGPARPDTAISSIRVEAGFVGLPAATTVTRSSCRDCVRRSVSRQHDFGYFWPAIGSTRRNVHQINMYDPSGIRRWDVRIEWMHRP